MRILSKPVRPNPKTCTVAEWAAWDRAFAEWDRQERLDFIDSIKAEVKAAVNTGSSKDFGRLSPFIPLSD